jgi:hypothetical protein
MAARSVSRSPSSPLSLPSRPSLNGGSVGLSITEFPLVSSLPTIVESRLGRSIDPIRRQHQPRERAFGRATPNGVFPGDETWAARRLDPIDVEVRPWIRPSGSPFDRAHPGPDDAQARGLCRRRAFDDDPGRGADQPRTPPLRLPRPRQRFFIMAPPASRPTTMNSFSRPTLPRCCTPQPSYERPDRTRPGGPTGVPRRRHWLFRAGTAGRHWPPAGSGTRACCSAAPRHRPRGMPRDRRRSGIR